MTPVEFEGQNTVVAKGQPEHQPLPALVTDDGIVVSCWKFNWWERIRILIFGELWHSQMTFNRGINPTMLTVENPLIFKEIE